LDNPADDLQILDVLVYPPDLTHPMFRLDQFLAEINSLSVC
jgi:hypothetical protein